MCFGNKLNQNRPEHCITPFPTPNNFCGGFALNAVLVDLGSGTCPIEVYMRIQDYQNKEIIEKNPNSSASIYLLGNKSSGTLMSLPSGICAAFKDYVTDRTKVAELMSKRHMMYNDEMDYVHSEAQKGGTFLVCPDSKLDIGRLDLKEEKMREVYEAGVNKARELMPQIKAFLAE